MVKIARLLLLLCSPVAAGCMMRSQAIPNQWPHPPVSLAHVRVIYQRPEAHFVDLGSVPGSSLSQWRREAAKMGADAIWVRASLFSSQHTVTAIRFMHASH